MTIEERRDKVSQLVEEGKTNAQIAKELGVSSSTISSDKKAIRKSEESKKKETVTEKPEEETKEPANKTSEEHEDDDSMRDEYDFNDKYINKAKNLIEEARQQAHDTLVPDEHKTDASTTVNDEDTSTTKEDEDPWKKSYDTVVPPKEEGTGLKHLLHNDISEKLDNATATGFMVGCSVGLVSMLLIMLIFG
jgi:transposase